MPTKLSRFAEGFMEAAWLAAVMLVPVFFNIYSSRIFEPDKITLLRTITLVLLAAWLVKLFEQGGFHWNRIPKESGWIKSFLRIPLMPAVTGLAIIYLISTIFSVTPFTSFWGSYQRLQGTYTTLSYLVIFFALIANLRQRNQVERLITIAIISSLPVSLYGVLQRYQADPIPWGGDTTQRIAANLGNSIFVAAYLVMAFPLAFLRAIESFEAMLSERSELWPNFARATCYSFILALQVIAIFFSGSRGPWLGLGTGLIVIWLGLSLVWRKRWLTISGVTLILLAASFLTLLNIPNGPLESLRNQPGFGRLGQLLDAESRTGRVRTLIWQGAADLMTPHDPLEFPDGRKDSFNFLRPLIGYGPESMYVAYNPFYPPELTQVEKRNASPDRSHNETWDSLVITGVLGLAAYLTLFGSLLYFGLKWLDLVPGKKQRNVFLGLYLSGGLLSTIIFVIYGGKGFLGVALPFGMVLGAVTYMILISLFGKIESRPSDTDRIRSYIIIGLLAAISAHFVEINFGIAIAATRVYFWVFAGLLLLMGYILPLYSEFASSTNSQTVSEVDSGISRQKLHDRRTSGGSSRRKPGVRRAPVNEAGLFRVEWIRSAVSIGLLVGLLLTTLGYEYISNTSREPSAIGLVWASLTAPAREGTRNGILPLLITTWLISLIILSSESVQPSSIQNITAGKGNWWKIIGYSAAISLGLAFICWTWNAAGLVALGRDSARTIDEVLVQVRDSEQILTKYYIQVFLFLFGLAVVLPTEWPAVRARARVLSYAVGTFLLILAFTFSAYSNLRVIQADIAFKTGDLFARPDSWPAAIAIYNRANLLAPNEDYYYLFLGRAYLEFAKTLENASERENLINQASKDLQKAQEINPLNTDHTANLARLYSLWATFTQENELRRERAQISADFFDKALILSPNNARLWDESAVLYLNELNQPQEAFTRLQHALELDASYDWTYGLLGEYFSQVEANRYPDQPVSRQQALSKAAEYYYKALETGKSSASSQLLFNYSVSLGGILTQLERLNEAIQVYETALQLNPESADSWRINFALSQLNAHQGEFQAALQYAEQALSLAPEDQKPIVDEFIKKLGGNP